jgi:hypothetical protein
MTAKRSACDATVCRGVEITRLSVPIGKIESDAPTHHGAASDRQVSPSRPVAPIRRLSSAASLSAAEAAGVKWVCGPLNGGGPLARAGWDQF